MDDYEPTMAGRFIEQFVDEHLSNWYVRFCRRRFWKGEYEQDKSALTRHYMSASKPSFV
jgi:isoleucyl-tRNA synthetase